METKSKKSILGRMFGAYAQDATPEELELAVDEIVKACTDEEAAPTEPVKEAPVQEEGEEKSLQARMDRLEAAVGKLVQALVPKKEPNALDTLEAELARKPEEAESADEESVTVEPETGESGTCDSRPCGNPDADWRLKTHCGANQGPGRA